MNPQRSLRRAITLFVKEFFKTTTAPTRDTRRAAKVASAHRVARGSKSPADFIGVPTISYAPHEDHEADPGEVVWTWVPFEEDASEGKDRPVLIIGRDDRWLLAIPLTSVRHDLDREQERNAGRLWLEIGSGDWDREHRKSFVRINRILRIDNSQVRRIGCRLDKARFDQVAEAVLKTYRS